MLLRLLIFGWLLASGLGGGPRACGQVTPASAAGGIFFLVVETTIETREGLLGFRPGTRVLQQPNGRYLLAGHLIALRPDQITGDPRVAAQVAAADQAAQAKIQQAKASQARALEQQQVTQAQQEAARRQTAREAGAKAEEEALTRAETERQTRIADIRAQLATAKQAKSRLRLSADIVAQDAKIRALQNELSKLGVRGAMLE